VQVRDNALDSGGNNDFIFSAVTGTPAASNPAVPATPTNALVMYRILVPGGVANLNTATLTDRRMSLSPKDVLHSRMARTAAYTIPASAANLPFDTVQQDNYGLWVPASNGWVCPVAGLYAVSWSLLMQALAATQSLYAWVAKNGAQGQSQYQNGAALNGNYTNAAYVGAIACVAGDVLSVQTSASSNAALNQGAPYNYASCDYLGTG
jgi:hypothetical protein